MSSLDAKGDLAAVEIAFFTPALLISIAVVIRHGFAKQLGWLYLVILSLLRLVGGSVVLYMETQNDYSSGLLTTAAITSAVGTAPLLLALLGFLERINEGMAGKGVNTQIFRFIHLASLVGLILAIVGGTDESGSEPSSTGRSLMKAASILFLAMYLALCGVTLLTFHRRTHIFPSEKKLLYAGLAALPLLLVRIIYTVIVSFSGPGSDFYFKDVNVWAESFMQFLMEAVVVTLFVTAGLMTPKKQKTAAVPVSSYKETGADGSRVQNMESGYAPPPVSQPPRPQRSLGDYRPSRLIRDAVSGR